MRRGTWATWLTRCTPPTPTTTPAKAASQAISSAGRSPETGSRHLGIQLHRGSARASRARRHQTSRRTLTKTHTGITQFDVVPASCLALAGPPPHSRRRPLRLAKAFAREDAVRRQARTVASRRRRARFRPAATTSALKLRWQVMFTRAACVVKSFPTLWIGAFSKDAWRLRHVSAQQPFRTRWVTSARGHSSRVSPRPTSSAAVWRSQAADTQATRATASLGKAEGGTSCGPSHGSQLVPYSSQ